MKLVKRVCVISLISLVFIIPVSFLLYASTETGGRPVRGEDESLRRFLLRQLLIHVNDLSESLVLQGVQNANLWSSIHNLVTTIEEEHQQAIMEGREYELYPILHLIRRVRNEIHGNEQVREPLDTIISEIERDYQHYLIETVISELIDSSIHYAQLRYQRDQKKAEEKIDKRLDLKCSDLSISLTRRLLSTESQSILSTSILTCDPVARSLRQVAQQRLEPIDRWLLSQARLLESESELVFRIALPIAFIPNEQQGALSRRLTEVFNRALVVAAFDLLERIHQMSSQSFSNQPNVDLTSYVCIAQHLLQQILILMSNHELQADHNHYMALWRARWDEQQQLIDRASRTDQSTLTLGLMENQPHQFTELNRRPFGTGYESIEPIRHSNHLIADAPPFLLACIVAVALTFYLFY